MFCVLDCISRVQWLYILDMINNLKCLLVTSSYHHHADSRNNQFSSSTFFSSNESETNFKGVGSRTLSWMNVWHIVVLMLEITFTVFLVVLWIFLSCHLRCFNCYLIFHCWIVVYFFWISNLFKLIRSIASIIVLLFLFVALIIGGKTLVHLQVKTH